MAYDPTLVSNLREALEAALAQVPGVQGRVTVDISSVALGDQTIAVVVQPDSAAGN